MKTDKRNWTLLESTLYAIVYCLWKFHQLKYVLIIETQTT